MENIYIQEVKLNGIPVEGTSITYEQIKAGGVLEFTMASVPVK
jgi:putative alpha-1,2-mannosidase